MSYTLQGKLHLINEAKQVSDKFTVKDFVIQTDGQYPQLITMQASNKSIEWLDKCKVGDEVEVAFDVRGRQWNDKFFNTLSAYSIKVISAATAVPANSGHPYATGAPIPTVQAIQNLMPEQTDLPF